MIVKSLPGNNEGKKIIYMEGLLTVATVNSVRKSLVFYLQNTEEVVLDMSKVADIDCAGIQLLMYLRKVAEQNKKNIKICKYNILVTDAIARLNVGYLLD